MQQHGEKENADSRYKQHGGGCLCEISIDLNGGLHDAGGVLEPFRALISDHIK